MTCLRLFRTAYYNMYIDLFVLFVAEVGHSYNTCPYLWWGSLLLTNGIKEASKSSDLQYGISAQEKPTCLLTQPPDSASSPYSVFALTLYNLKNLTSILFTLQILTQFTPFQKHLWFMSFIYRYENISHTSYNPTWRHWTLRNLKPSLKSTSEDIFDFNPRSPRRTSLSICHKIPSGWQLDLACNRSHWIYLHSLTSRY